MKQVTLPFPFVWLTIRVEPASVARQRARFFAPPPPPALSRDVLKRTFDARLLRDIGLDDSRAD